MLPIKKQTTLIQQKIFDAKASKCFVDYTEVDELMNDVKAALQQISIDLGIRTMMDDGTIARCIEFLLNYYGRMSVTDLCNAFEFLIVGKLDKWLPRDSRGNIQKEHYQQFSIEYLTKILNAYRTFIQNEPGVTPVALLPERIVTPAEKAQKRLTFVKQLIEWADKGHPKETYPLLGSEYLYEQFIVWGLVPAAGRDILCEEFRVMKSDVYAKILYKDDYLVPQRAALIIRAIDKLKLEFKTLESIVSEHERTN